LKKHHFKLSAIFSLITLLVIYTNCGQPFNKPTDLVFSGNIYGGSSEASVAAFQTTVYPITRANCINCHSTTQPLHAADDVNVAHDAVINGFKVNFSNIPASRLVAKLRDENHNCWGVCADNASEMQTAIEKWNDAIKNTGGETTVNDGAIYTAESLTLENEFADGKNPLKSNTIQLNIESALLKSPMTITRPTGSEAYLSVPTNLGTTLTNTDVNAGIAYMSFKVPATAQYKVWALAHGPADADNSFYVNVLNGSTSMNGGARQFDIATGTRFDWRQVPNITPTLVAGTTYTLELRQREDGARIAGFIITADPAFNGVSVNDFFGITLSYDLSNLVKVPNVSFKIDVIDYDLYSYKFSKPRIVTPTSSIYVKNVKIYVNGSYSPQHSTYTLVDKIVSPGNDSLSTYSMVVIKDKGLVGDHIKFSFDQLAVTGGTTGGTTTGGTTGGGTGGETSLVAFQATVYPISRSSSYSCVGCHTAVTPKHASDNTLTAHDAALTVVDFDTPANSRIVRKMKVERHNCQAQCDDIGNQYQNAIQEWKNRRQ
jgi:hypothetical protein